MSKCDYTEFGASFRQGDIDYVTIVFGKPAAPQPVPAPKPAQAPAPAEKKPLQGPTAAANLGSRT